MDNPVYDRSRVFAEQIIKLVQTIKQDAITRPMINQLVRSSTSIGANLSEATFGSSRKDFVNKITIALKESHESLYWISLLETTGYIPASDACKLKESVQIIGKILNTIKTKTADKAVS